MLFHHFVNLRCGFLTFCLWYDWRKYGIAGEVSVVVPIDTKVPITAEVPVNTNLSLKGNTIDDQTIHFQKEIPVSMNFRTRKSVSELGLSEHIDQIHVILNSLRLFFMAEPKDLDSYESVPQVEVEYIDLVLEGK